MNSDATGGVGFGALTEENRRVLLGALDWVDLLVAARDAADELDAVIARQRDVRREWWESAITTHDEGSNVPIVRLAQTHQLTPPEVDAVVLALAPLLDPEFLDRLARLRDRMLFRGLDVELALSLLFHTREDRLDGRWLFSAEGRLVRFGLIQLVPLESSLSTDGFEVKPTDTLANLVFERPELAGPMARFASLRTPEHTWDSVILPREDKERVWRMASTFDTLGARLAEWGYEAILPRGRGRAMLFAGPPGTGKTALAHAIADRLGCRLIVVRTSQLLAVKESIEPVLADIFRIAKSLGAVVLIDDCEPLLAHRDQRFLAVLESLDDHDGLLVMTTNNAPAMDFAMARRIAIRVDFRAPESTQRHQIWEVHLPPELPMHGGLDLPWLASSFEFTGAQIRNTVLAALAQMVHEDAPFLTMEHLVAATGTQLGSHFDDLAVRTEARMTLDDLVLPEVQRAQVQEVVSACRHREHILTHWGFGEKLSKGRGLCILFDGPPGTGKTFTAELIAAELRLPVYQVHIPNVVSKWVGETERNIAQIFKRGRAARAVLLFDEADSLFSRRSTTTQGANDRYANMEVNLILQELERYDGISVLTTNLFGNLDEALQRRIQFRVTFPFPSAEQRAGIWRVLIPSRAPLGDDVDFMALGTRFELAGGHIKNAILRAAYKARADTERISQRHLVEAATAECQAQGRVVRAQV